MMNISKVWELPLFELKGEFNEETFDKLSAWLHTERKDKKIALRITSPGGLVDHSLWLYDLIREQQLKTGIEVIGVVSQFCYSAALNVYLACDYRIASVDARFMSHNFTSQLEIKTKYKSLSDQELAEMTRKQIDSLLYSEKRAIQIFVERTKISEDEAEKVITEKTWYFGDDIIKLGIAHQLYNL